MAAEAGEAIQALHRLMRTEVRTGVIAKVLRYDPATATADVQFLVQETRDLADGAQEVGPVTVEGAPVFWPSGLVRRLDVDSRVLVQYRHRSHDEIDGGAAGPLVPSSGRRMSSSDVTVLPGYVCPATGLPASAFRADGQPVLAMPTGEAFHVGDSAAALLLARSDLVLDRLTAIHAAISGHEHAYFPGALAAAVTTGGPTYASPSTVESDRIKVDS